MAKCINCVAVISERAKTCPKCGEPNPNRLSLLQKLMIMAVIILAIYLYQKYG